MKFLLTAGVAAIAAMAGYLAGRQQPAATQSVTEVGRPPARPTTGDPGADREKLLLLSAWVYDRVSADAVRQRIDYELEQCGVHLIESEGIPLDSTRHEKVGTEITADPARVGRIARTVSPGLRDGERVLRRAQVAVFVTEQNAAEEVR